MNPRLKSGQWESNPRTYLGKVEGYHYITVAYYHFFFAVFNGFFCVALIALAISSRLEATAYSAEAMC